MNTKNTNPIPERDKHYKGKMVMTTFPKGNNWGFCSDYLDDYRFEYENSTALWEFEEWVALEQFFGQRISKKTYEDLAAYYNDYEADVDILCIDGHKRAFRTGDSAVFTQSNKKVPYRCTIIHLEESDEKHRLKEQGSVYLVRTEDGHERYALYSELSKQTGANDEDEAFRTMCYETYKLDWMLTNGYTLSDLKDILLGLAIEDIKKDPILTPTNEKSAKALAERVTERFMTEEGFGNGLVYADRDEFLNAEFLDEYYMSRLLSITPDAKKNMLRWRRVTGIKKQ